MYTDRNADVLLELVVPLVHILINKPVMQQPVDPIKQKVLQKKAYQ